MIWTFIMLRTTLALLLASLYAALSAHQDRMIAAMGGREVHITTPSGTDLRVRVEKDSWFHKNDGRLERERVSQARSVRDREMELPAGALRFIPDVDSADGVLVVPEWAGVHEVRFEFRQGLVVHVTSKNGHDKVQAAWARESGDKDRIAEMVIGTNPKLPSTGPGRMPPYYGYGAGVFRVAMGDNWESGGDNTSSLEAWFQFTDATIGAGEVVIVKNGRLVLP